MNEKRLREIARSFCDTRVGFHGSSYMAHPEGDCENCKRIHAAILKLVEEENFILLSLTDAMNKSGVRLRKEKDALESQIAEFRKAEKETSDAYLRIRELVGAWDTNYGGENRYEVTEQKIKDLLELKREVVEILIKVTDPSNFAGSNWNYLQEEAKNLLLKLEGKDDKNK